MATKTLTKKSNKSKFDKQKIFNRIAKHLLKQNKQALDDSDSCQYRTADGLSCAVGCLIPESLYDDVIEGTGLGYVDAPGENEEAVEALKRILKKTVGATKQAHIDFLHSLQLIHDRCKPDAWPERLHFFAAEHRLKNTVLPALEEIE